MNYIALVNQFWQLRREVPFSSVEADLYFYLLEISNSLQWKNPFQQSNALIGATLGISEKTLIGARNRLKQHDLIDFTPGVKRTPSTYRLLVLKHRQVNTLENFQPIREECDSESGSKSGSESDSVSGTNTPDIIKHKLNKTKKKEANASSAPPLTALPLPEESPSPYQQAFQTWQHWARENAADVLRMKNPLTPIELHKLVADYGQPMVWEVFQAMHNHAQLLSKYKSANLTARDWCKRRAADPKAGSAVAKARTNGTQAAKIQRQTQNEYF